tara:strand:+ start:704 stop:838 length:135 start_codon:yes stop_codon:yes gene_type:complete
MIGVGSNTIRCKAILVPSCLAKVKPSHLFQSRWHFLLRRNHGKN